MVKLGLLLLALALSLFLGVSAQIKHVTIAARLSNVGVADFWTCAGYVTGCNGKSQSIGCSTTDTVLKRKGACSSGTHRHSDGFDFKIEECSGSKGVLISVDGYKHDYYLSLGAIECSNITDRKWRQGCEWRNDIDISSCF